MFSYQCSEQIGQIVWIYNTLIIRKYKEVTMKKVLALGIFIGFFISCVFFIVLAPNSVHEVIDRIHGNSDSNGESSVVPKDDSGAGVIPSDEKSEPVEVEVGAKLPPPTDEPKPRLGAKLPPRFDRVETGELAKLPPRFDRVETGTLASLRPRTENEMLDWLKENNYTVTEKPGFYRIYWQHLKPVSPKPTAIVVNGDGTVVPQDGSHMVANRGSIVSAGNNTSTVKNNENGITTTASIKYKNGSWWIETIRYFDWYPRWDDINDVLSKAKKIKEMNDEN